MVLNDGAIAGLSAETRAALSEGTVSNCGELTRAERMELVKILKPKRGFWPTQNQIDHLRGLEAYIAGGCDGFEAYGKSLPPA